MAGVDRQKSAHRDCGAQVISAGIAQRESGEAIGARSDAVLLTAIRLNEALPPRRSRQPGTGVNALSVSSPAPRSNPFHDKPRLPIGTSLLIWLGLDVLIIAALVVCLKAILGVI